MHKSIYLTLTCIFLVFSGCRKDSFTETMTSTPPDVIDVNFVDARVQGVVVDQNNSALADVLVRWGENNMYTDENGVFIIEGTVREKQARLEISKDGFFTTRQVLQTHGEENVSTRVQLITRELTESISSQIATTVETNLGAKISFAADGFVNEDGSAYEGDVHVYAYYLDPSRDDLVEIMPGNLLAQNEDNDLQVLQSYAMLNVELEDSQGRTIQLSKAAELSFPVPDALHENAPSIIPLWFYDLEDDLWKEEGQAVLEGNNYIGSVDHFTWWNCDIPRDFVYLKGIINPIRGSYWDHTVRLTIVSTSASAIATVSQEGSFAGFVPQGEMFILEILNTCGDPVYTATIGAFFEDTVLDPITVTTPPEDWFLISGTLLDCDNNPVTNGYVSVNYANQGRPIFVDEQGTFAEVFPECIDNELRIVGVDLENLKSSPTYYETLDMDLEIDLLNACDELAGEFIISLQGDSIIGKPCTMNVLNISPGFDVYDITMVHMQENGSVIYRLQIGNGNADTDPLNWNTIDYVNEETIVNGDPDIIFDFDTAGSSGTEILENSGMTGDIFHFVAKVIAENILTGQILDGADLEIKALIL